jgi:hypothetical protein
LNSVKKLQTELSSAVKSAEEASANAAEVQKNFDEASCERDAQTDMKCSPTPGDAKQEADVATQMGKDSADELQNRQTQ